MQVILQGSLRHFPAAELLCFLCRRGLSGTLDLETPGRRTRILFEIDTIVWAESNKVPDAVEAVLDAFQWTSGTFTVLDSLSLPENVKPLAVELQTVIDEARKRAEAGSLYPDATLFRLIDNPALQQQVSLTGDEFKMLFRLSSGRTFRELVADLGIDRKDVAERLKKFESLGLVASIQEEPEPPPVQTMVQQRKTLARKKTVVGSLTPDDNPDSVYPLLDAECVIGRLPESGIPIVDGSISSRHARILRTAEGFVLEDLQSRNGTFVNGEKVEKPRLLADGDMIRFGKVILTFNIAKEVKASETTQPEVKRD